MYDRNDPTADVLARYRDDGTGEAKAQRHADELNAAVAAGELPDYLRYEIGEQCIKDGAFGNYNRYHVVVRRDASKDAVTAMPETIALPDGKTAKRIDEDAPPTGAEVRDAWRDHMAKHREFIPHYESERH